MQMTSDNLEKTVRSFKSYDLFKTNVLFQRLSFPSELFLGQANKFYVSPP